MSSEAVAVLEIEGKQFPLKAGKNYLIGRKTRTVEEDVTQLDIELESQSLDAKHALLRVSDEEIRILDLYSKLGTFLNGQRLEGLLELKIDTNGRLQLGEVIGSLQFHCKLQSHDSSGFHDGQKNTSDIICSSPEPATLSGTRLKHLQKSSLTSTPNVNQPEAIFSDDLNTQCNFLIPPVPESKSSVANKSRTSLVTAEASLNSSANSSLAQQNKSVDSFCIPETQQYPGRPSLDNNSNARDVSVAVTDASGANSLLNKCGVDDEDDEVDDQDFCIPETQEVMPVGIVSSQAHKRFQAERAVLDANLPANMFVEEDENFAAHEGGSQFRICTQDFNDVDCFNDERSNDSDLLADQAFSSLIIPRITHEAAAIPTNADKEDNAGKEGALSEQKEQSIHDVEEISAQNCSEEGAKSTLLEEALEQREGSCTPDLFELPAEQSSKEANEVNDIAAVPCQATNTNEGGTKVPIELPSTSFKLPTIPVTEIASIFEDDDDFMPTQVFSIKPPAPKDPKKVTAGKCSPEYLTLSDKENILPAAAAAMLEAAVDLMQPTQVFDLNIISDEELFMTTTTTVTRIESTTNTAAQAAPDPSPQQQQPPQPADEDDDDLLPTQVFPSGESNTARAGEKTPTKQFLSSTLLSTSTRETSSTASAKMEPTEMPPPPLQKAPSLTNASYSESPDIDLLLCTPQIIASNFGKSDVKPKLTLLDKQKTLFGDDSDEAVDALELIDAPPKVPHDFDKLLPHLSKPNESPKREEVDAKLHHYNRSFGERGGGGGEDPKGKNKSKEEQRRVTRNRDERHLERDKQRERKDESDTTNEKKAAETRGKRNEKKAENANATNEKSDKQCDKNDNQRDKKLEDSKANDRSDKSDKQRDKKLEEAKANDKSDKQRDKKLEDAKASNKQRDKRTTNSASNAQKVEAENPPKNEKKIEETKKQTRSSRAATRSSAEKIEQKQEEPSTAKRTDRKRKNTETAAAAELPPRRLTRQKSRVEGELITEPQKPAEATSRRTRRKTKDDEHEQKEKRDVTPKEVATTKRKKLSASSSQSSTSSSSNKESNSQASKMANKESNSQVGKSAKRDSNSQERKSAKRDSNSQERKTTVASKSDEAITASQERRQTRYRSTASLVSTSQGSSSAQASPATAIATNTPPEDASDAQTKLRKPKQIQVSMTMVDPEHFQNLAKNAADIWTVAKDPVESDILIMDKGNRTFKFLIAMAKGIPIVTSKWLEKVNNSGQIVNMTDHLYTDEAFERRHKFSLLKSIHMARKQKLFADRHFIMTPGIRPQPSELEAIIKCAGGIIHTDVPTTLKNNQKLYLVSSKDEKKLWHKYRRLTSQISIISSEGVMAAVMRQVVKPLETNILA